MFNTSSVSANVTGRDHDGDPSASLYDAYFINGSCFWYGGNSVAAACTGDPNSYYWNDSVGAYVYKSDSASYFGTEESAIVAYQRGGYSASDLTVSDKTGAVDVSINITNTQGSTQNISVLCMLKDMDMIGPAYGQEPMINGYPVYPNVHSPDSGTWSFFNAINHSTYSAYQTKTLTWTNIYTAGSGEWQVWCQGETDTWTNP